jgi:hypothetical protein
MNGDVMATTAAYSRCNSSSSNSSVTSDGTFVESPTQSVSGDRIESASLDPYNVGRCLVGFMQYFATTDLNNIVFAPANECPTTHSRCVPPHIRTPAVLEDPLDSTNDIVRGSFNFFRVQELWWYSLHALSSYVPNMVPSTLSTFINPRDFTFLSRFENKTSSPPTSSSLVPLDDRGE